MARVTRKEQEEAPAQAAELRAPPPVRLGRAVRLGAVGGLALIFMATIGMVEQFDRRAIVEGFSLAFVVILGAPAFFGYLAGKPPPQLEGFAPGEVGSRNVAAGAIAGVLTGGLSGLYALVAPVDLRSVFPNISPTMVELLTFGMGTGLGLLVSVVAGLVAGAAGAAMHVLRPRLRKAILGALLWVAIFGVMETVIAQIIRSSRSLGIDLLIGAFGEEPDPPFLLGAIYDIGGGGLRFLAAIIVGVAAFGLYYWLGGRRTTVRARLQRMEPSARRRTLIVGAVVLLVLLGLLPLVVGRFLSQVLDIALIFLLMGLGLNIVLGFAGLLDLGYVAFFAVGAYTTAVLTSPIAPAFDSAPALGTFFLAIPFVMAAAAVAGIIVGTPVLRMRGDYLAIVTLGFGEIARILFLSDALADFFGGARGIRQTPSILLTPMVLSVFIAIVVAFLVFLIVGRRVADRGARGSWTSFGVAVAVAAILTVIGNFVFGTVLDIGSTELDNPQLFFYGILIFALLAAYVSWALEDSRIGRAWMAMREDELVAEAMGVNIVSAKLWAFIVGAILASFGGALFATKIHSVFPQSFAIIVSIQILLIVILGGMGSMRGIVVGALVLIALPNLLREFEAYRFLLYGALLIYMMLQRPEGFIPSRRRAAELHEEDRTQDQWLREAQAEVQGERGKPAPAGTG
jgi:branched-chain amino acid transport system permease protein